MKLSEAILLGSMLRPQAFGHMTDGVGTCAWGAAEEAMGTPLNDLRNSRGKIGALRPQWNWTADEQDQCPVCGLTRDVANIISEHLNDTHRWTRERIAEWVAAIEPQEPIAVQVNDVVQPQVIAA